MGKLIDDEILETFAVVAEPDQIAPRAAAPLRRRRHPRQLLRAVQVGPRHLAAGGRRPPGRLTTVRRPAHPSPRDRAAPARSSSTVADDRVGPRRLELAGVGVAPAHADRRDASGLGALDVVEAIARR